MVTNFVPLYSRYEMIIAAPDATGNPFDTRDIALHGEVTLPDGSIKQIDGFAYRSYNIEKSTETTDNEMIVAGPLEYRIRYAPTMAGEHHIRTWFSLPNKAIDAGEDSFIAEIAENSGYVRISPNQYTFMTEDGNAFYPIGSNMCWASSYGVLPGQKLEDLLRMMRELAESGGTAFRLWANASWAHSIDWTPSDEKDALRFGEISMSGCAKLDVIVEEAERLGLRIMFCIDAANNWVSNNLSRTPYGIENGGPCKTTADYFNLPEARLMTREKMKYVAARWGYSTAIWCWEFWNEVDGCGIEFVNAHQQLAWHQEMAQVLRQADPVNHIITTSTGHPLNFAAVWRMPEMEFTHTHHYGYMDSVEHISTMLKGYHESNVAFYKKPHIASEVGVSFTGAQSVWEKDGSTLHNVLWSTTLLAKSCGPGFMWFWDEYIHRYGLQTQYIGIAKFLRDERWHEVETEPLEITPLDIPPRQFDTPVELKVPSALSGSDYYRSIFTIERDGRVEEGHLVPNTYYGTDRPHVNFRLTFNVDFPQDGLFTPMVWGGGNNCNGIVSGSNATGEPIAEIRVDDVVALRRPVCTERKDKKSDDLYCDRLSVSVPAGKHTVSITNVGEGMFIAGHILLTNYRTSKPRVTVQGLQYPGHALLWIYNTDYTWHTSRYGTTVEPVSGMSVNIKNIETGKYKIEWWDTITGEIIACDEVNTNEDGLTAKVPDFVNDIAAKCVMI